MANAPKINDPKTQSFSFILCNFASTSARERKEKRKEQLKNVYTLYKCENACRFFHLHHFTKILIYRNAVFTVRINNSKLVWLFTVNESARVRMLFTRIGPRNAKAVVFLRECRFVYCIYSIAFAPLTEYTFTNINNFSTQTQKSKVSDLVVRFGCTNSQQINKHFLNTWNKIIAINTHTHSKKGRKENKIPCQRTQTGKYRDWREQKMCERFESKMCDTFSRWRPQQITIA